MEEREKEEQTRVEQDRGAVAEEPRGKEGRRTARQSLLYKVTAFAICEDLQKRNKLTHSITHSLHPRM